MVLAILYTYIILPKLHPINNLLRIHTQIREKKYTKRHPPYSRCIEIYLYG